VLKQIVEGSEGKNSLLQILRDFQHKALTYETYVVALDGRDNQTSAAFVAASAHQLCMQVNELLLNDDQDHSEYISPYSINPTVSASLLYFVAGYTADAAEIAKKISSSNEGRLSATLLVSNLKYLLQGNVSAINSEVKKENGDDFLYEDQALDGLWNALNAGVIDLKSALSTWGQISESSFRSATDRFRLVKKLSVDLADIQIGNLKHSFLSMLSGPRHLASLLEIVARTLPNKALISVKAPLGIDEERWKLKLVDFALVRPFLWPNHLYAIDSGYLEYGISSVVSFPTGGGKSTLAELKIATYALNGRSVIFIVPTLALVDQVAKNLQQAFPAVTTKLDSLGFGILGEMEVLPDISVMTPESCLARMSFSPELFDDIGLLIFDECHLLHPKGEMTSDRRSIDSMLALLRIMQLSPSIDLLLMSAMVKNNEEIAGWLNSILGRKVLSLNISWKPTRQAKGCVVYNANELDKLNRYVRDVAPRTPAGRLTAGAKRNLVVEPYVFVSLNQTWSSSKVADYRLLKLSDDPVTLGLNNFNGLTANRNVTAALIAKKSGYENIKTLIFSSIPKECDSIIKIARYKRENGDLVFTPDEQHLMGLIAEEFGHIKHSYTSLESSCLPHHGLLIKEERALHESLFKRPDGVNILVATSTLAQGINLPAQLVIIAGNTRFDVDAGQSQELDAHELLNAAGRAGRAGESSQGLVLVIPSKVVGFNSQTNKIAQYWGVLQNVFSESDQCIDVVDPITGLLDEIYQNPNDLSENTRYFINRVPIDNQEHAMAKYLGHTFGRYKADLRNERGWIDERIKSASEAYNRIRNIEHKVSWYDQLASATGISSSVIEEMHRDFSQALDGLNDAEKCVAWLIDWISVSSDRLNSFLRDGYLSYVFGRSYSDLKNENEKCEFVKVELFNILSGWIAGDTLSDLELAIGTDEKNIGRCGKARRFAIRLVSDVSYAASVLSQIYQYHFQGEENNEKTKLFLTLLSQLIKAGLDSPEKLALYQILKESTCRVHCHKKFDQIVPYLDDTTGQTDFMVIHRAVRIAYNKWENIPS